MTEDRGKWWTLGAVCLGMFMLLLDITIVNVALPAIRTDLKANFSDLQWVVDAYALSLASLLLTAGTLADLFGRRKLFAIGLVVFVAASIACGLSGSPIALILARGAQGIGGSVMLATSLALVASAFHGPERGTAFGLYGATIGAAVAVGPLVGGALVDGIGWQWIFFVNAPVGAIALAVTLLRVRETRDPGATGIDWIGFVTFSGALFLLVFALVRGNAEGWGSPLIVGFLIGAVVLLVAFVIGERMQARPMLDFGLFRKPTFAGASIVAFSISSAMFSLFLYITLYVQTVLGYTPLESGLRFLPLTVVSFFVAPVAGRLSVRMPVRYLLSGGMALIGIALVSMHAVSVGDDWTVLLPGFLIAGLGIGFVNAPLVNTAVAVAPAERSGMASGINNTFRQVGIATGIAAFGAVFEHEVTRRAVLGLGPLGHRLGQAFSAGQGRTIAQHVPPALRQRVQHTFEASFVTGLQHIFVIAAIVAFGAALLALVLVRQRDFIASAPSPGPEAEPAPAAAA